MLPILFYLWTDVQLFFLIVNLFSGHRRHKSNVNTATDTKIYLSFHHTECSLKTDAVITFSDHFKFYFDVTQSSDIQAGELFTYFIISQ